MTIFEKLNAKLYTLHEVCKILYLAVNNILSDSRVIKPTYQKWINRIDKLKTIELCARVDPNALMNAMPTTKLVRSLRDFIIFLVQIEARWLELKGDFENHKDIVVPPLLKNDQSIKEYVEWRNETITQVSSLINSISQDVNMYLLQKSLLQLVESNNVYDNFIKEFN